MMKSKGGRLGRGAADFGCLADLVWLYKERIQA